MGDAASIVGSTSIVILTSLGLRHRLRPRARSAEADTPGGDARPSHRIAHSVLRHQLTVWVVWALGLATLAAIVDPILALVAGFARLGWPRLRAEAERRRRRARIDATAPDAIELLVLLIHAGLTPHQAVEMMCVVAPEPIAPGFQAVLARHRRGAGLADALGALTDTLGHQLTIVVDTLAIAVRHGTPIGPALAQLSSDVRLRRRRHAEAAARRLPVRLSFPLVFCTLPAFVLVAIAPAVLAALSSLGETTW